MLILLALPQNMTVLSGQEKVCSMGESSPRQVKPRTIQKVNVMAKRKRDLSKALMLTGDTEFYELFSVGEKLLAQMRKKGMPHYSSGYRFSYDPREAHDWIKRNWKIQIPQLPEIKAQ